jgi:hypothetical protein
VYDGVQKLLVKCYELYVSLSLSFLKLLWSNSVFGRPQGTIATSYTSCVICSHHVLNTYEVPLE